MRVNSQNKEQSKKDEPVEKLLKRIKEEKENLIKEGRIKKEKTISEIYKKDGSYYERVSDGKNILKDVCIDDELPFEIPDSWAWVKINSISKSITAGGDKPNNYSEFKTEKFNIPILSNGKENDGVFGYTDIPKIIEPSITISSRGTIGFSCVRRYPYFPIVRLISIIPFNIINLDFVKIVFDVLIEKGVGTSVKQLTVPMLIDKLIPLPPIEEQGRIVDKINLLMPLINEYDSLEKNITKLNKEFPNSIKKSILQYAIEGKLTEQSEKDEPVEKLLKRIKEEKESLIKEGKIKKDKTTSEIYKKDGSYYERITDGKNILKEVCIDDELPFEIPDSWAWVRLGKLVYLISGTSYNKNDITDRGIRILRGGNIQNNQLLLFDDDVFLPASYYDEEKNIKKYDIIIVASTGSKTVIGKPAFIEDDYNNTQIGAFLRIIRLYYVKISSYINTIFESNYYREHIRNKVTGTNINNIKSDYVENLLIPLPPIEEQARIADKINRLNEIINTIKL